MSALNGRRPFPAALSRGPEPRRQMSVGIPARDVVTAPGAGHRLRDTVHELVALILASLPYQEIVFGHPLSNSFGHGLCWYPEISPVYNVKSGRWKFRSQAVR